MAKPSLPWFRRLADAPGVRYTPPFAVDRLKLPGHDAAPRVGRRVIVESSPQLEWLGRDGWTAQSPAQLWFGDERAPDLDLPAQCRQLVEALELPAEPIDYHFMIQGCLGSLWKDRRGQPWVLDVIEQFAWVNARLGLEYKTALLMGDFQVPIEAFNLLVTLYLREGWVRETVEVMHLAESYSGKPWYKREEILARLEALDSEPQ